MIHSSRPLESGLYKIPIETDGRLPLPPELLQTLGLEPGDIVGIDPARDFVMLRFYRELLTYDWTAAPGMRWTFTKNFLNLSLTAIEEGGVIAIPPELLPLRPGDRAHLTVSVGWGGYLWPGVALSRG